MAGSSGAEVAEKVLKKDFFILFMFYFFDRNTAAVAFFKRE